MPTIITKTAIAYGQSKAIGDYALAGAVNDLAAAGVTEVIEAPIVDIRVVIPEYAFKSRMNTMNKILTRTCREKGIVVNQIKIEKAPAVCIPTVIVHAAGIGQRQTTEKQERGSGGKDIVLTKWIGMDGMLRITEERNTEVKNRFSAAFLSQIQSFREIMWDIKELEVARRHQPYAVSQVTDGGIFAALWNLSKEFGTGLDIDLKKIAVRQETIEVCEHFQMNPYQLTSVGSFLLVVPDGAALLEELRGHGVPAEIIGRLTDNNDKIIHNGNEIRYIDRPAPDEVNKVMIGRE